jgi:hypothetical protein
MERDEETRALVVRCVEVRNLLDYDAGPQVYVGITPRQAVIAAYAQSRNDWNTWDYEGRYGTLVTEGKRTVACGDFCARTDG